MRIGIWVYGACSIVSAFMTIYFWGVHSFVTCAFFGVVAIVSAYFCVTA